MAFIDLKKLMESAHDDLKNNKLEDCYSKTLYLLDHDPNNFFNLYLLASYYSKKDHLGASIALYERAIALYPDFSESLNNAGGAYRKIGRYQKAIDYFKKAIETGEKNKFREKEGQKDLLADYYSNLGSAYVGMHEPDEAIRWLDEALEINPDCKNAKWNKSLVLLERGDYEQGFKYYENGERNKAKRDRNYKVDSDNTPDWNGEKDKTVVVYGEQGIGDELMFATILPDLAKDCKQVIYDAHPRLYRMFRNSFKELNIDCYGTRKDYSVAWVRNYEVDYKIPVASLPYFYRKKESDFTREPYLKVREKDIETGKAYLNSLPKKKLNIGISWKGGTQASSKKVRIMPMEQFNKFFENLDANFISLQYHDNAEHEIGVYTEKFGNVIHHSKEIVDDYEKTSGLVHELDLVLSVPQSVIHLAGAMGKRAYQLTPYRYIWQMGVYGHDMPWYNCVTNFWQPSHGDWESITQQALVRIKDKFKC